MGCQFLQISIPALLLSASVWASDWPQFLGPTRNGVYSGTDIAETWPAAGPPVVWQKAVGHGFSGPVVVDGKLVIFDRLNDQERVRCLDARTGNELWSFAYPTVYQDDFGFDDGPRATPAVSGERVYTFGAQGTLNCLELGSGKKLWSTDLQTEFQAGKGFFGMACSPLVEGNAVLLGIGGKQGAGIVALEKTTGKLLWKASDDEAGYSSPVAATIHGKRYALFLTRTGLVALNPADGRIQCQYSWRSRNPMSVNAATPLVIGDDVFLSASYGTGAVLLRLKDNEAEKIWSEEDLLSNHYATSVEFNGFLYGIHGRTDPGYSPHPKLRCIELKTKRVRWETDAVGAASLALARAQGQLLILTEKGELIAAKADPESFQASGRSRVLSSEVRAFPAIADGFFYARSKDHLVCLDLRAPGAK